MELITATLEKKFKQYPFGTQRSKGADAECIVKYYFGSWTLLVTEADSNQDDWLLYGYFLDLRHRTVRAEWGYVRLADLVSFSLCGFGAERDLYADGKTVRQLCRDLGVDVVDFIS